MSYVVRDEDIEALKKALEGYDNNPTAYIADIIYAAEDVLSNAEII